MDSMEQEKRQAMAEFRRARRRVSFSVVFFLLVGLLVSLSSWDQDLSLLLTGLPDCFWVDRRKAMFVLCNLILAVVAMDSGLLASFTPEEERCGEFSVTEKSHRSREEARRLSAGEDEFMFSCAHPLRQQLGLRGLRHHDTSRTFTHDTTIPDRLELIRSGRDVPPATPRIPRRFAAAA